MRFGVYNKGADIPDWILKKIPRTRFAKWVGTKPEFRSATFSQRVYVFRWLFGGNVHVYRSNTQQKEVAHWDGDCIIWTGAPTIWH